MSRLVRCYLPEIIMLRDSPPKMRRLILDKYGREFVRSICECTQNVLNGNVPITGNQKRRLSRFKWNLRELADRSVSDNEKTKILQKGGFLGCLLTPVVSLLENHKHFVMDRKNGVEDETEEEDADENDEDETESDDKKDEETESDDDDDGDEEEDDDNTRYRVKKKLVKRKRTPEDEDDDEEMDSYKRKRPVHPCRHKNYYIG